MRWAGFLALVSIGLLTACGGDGGSSSGGSGTTNPEFVGRWLGTWSSTGSFGSQSGTTDLTIAESGKMTGTLHNDTLGMDGAASGTVDANGNVDGTYTYGATTYTSSGKLVLQENGHLGGAVDTFEGSTKVGTSTFDMIKQ